MEACTKSCRFPGGIVEQLEQVAEDRDLLVSEVFRRAVRHYIRENPDGFEAFTRSTEPNVVEVDPETLGGGDPPEPPMGEESDSEVEDDESAPSVGVYDPTEDT